MTTPTNADVGVLSVVKNPTEQQCVRVFHDAFDLLRNSTPTLLDEQGIELRCRLIQEELDEYKEALKERNLVKAVDALCDLLYVTYGSGVSHGVDLHPLFREVHRSNMTKVGGYKDAGGKWIKPPTFDPPKLEPLLYAQGWEGPESERESNP